MTEKLIKDASGILHENFFLLPIGFMFLFAGMITFIVIGIKWMIVKKGNYSAWQTVFKMGNSFCVLVILMIEKFKIDWDLQNIS